MHVTIIGYGSMGKRHARNARSLGREVVVVDVDAARRDQATSDGFNVMEGLPTQSSHIVVATPAASHADMLGSACKGRAKVFVEKPLACDVASAVAAVAYGRDLAVGYNMRFHHHWLALRDIVASGRTKPATATFWLECSGSDWPGTNYSDALLEGSHEIDSALALLGPAKCVYASRSHTGQTWDVALLHDGGVPCSIHISLEAVKYERWAAVVGKDGRYAWWGWRGPTGRSLLVYPDKREETLHQTTEAAYRAEIEAFLDDKWTGCDLSGGLAVLRVCDRARELALMAHATT